MGQLPLAWGSERFLVVDAGNGKISLFNPRRMRFLCSKNGIFTANGHPIVSTDECPRAHEIFQILKSDIKAKYFYLFCCEIEGTNVKIQQGFSHFQAWQIQGFAPKK
jgi:hypothetical protein